MNAEVLTNVTVLPQPEPSTGIATITAVHADERAFTLEHGGRQLRARRAASCLLEPVIGDRVWMVSEARECFITAVLERRDEAAPQRLTLDGDVELHAGGALRLHGQSGVALDSPTSVSVATDALRVGARTGEFAFTELRAVAREVVATLARVTRVGQLLELFVDKVTQRSRHSVRAIEELDQTTARNVSVSAQDTMRLAAKDAVIQGERLVKMDGEQIHLG